MKALLPSLFLLCFATACASAPTESTAGSGSAIETGGAFTSPIEDGLYSDGTSFLRVTSDRTSIANGAVAVQSLGWDIAGTIGRANADVRSRSSVTAADEQSRRAVVHEATASAEMVTFASKLVIDARADGLDVTLTAGTSSTVHLKPIAYASLRGDFTIADAPGFAVSLDLVTDAGARLVIVTDAATDKVSSEVDLTWSTDGAVLTSDACKGVRLHPWGGLSLLSDGSGDPQCLALAALWRAAPKSGDLLAGEYTLERP